MANEKKTYAKPQYKCGICGEIYDSIQERMNCEMACLKKQAEEEKKAAEEKKKAEKEARQQEVDAALDDAFTIMNKFFEDYGAFKYGGKFKGANISSMDFFPSKLWHHFWF